MHQLIEDFSFQLIFSAIFGSIFGSFATALIYRLPNGVNWVSKRSECTKCKHKLGFFDLFPIFSYLFLKGKCRYCGSKFGNKYFLVELANTLIFVLIIINFGINLKSVILCLLAFSLLVLSVIDFEHYIIPDEINIFILILGVVYRCFTFPDFENLLFMPLFCLLFAMFLRWLMFVWKKREGLGFGDVKFFLAAGFFLEFTNFPAFLFISGLTGILIAIMWKILKKGELFPFGPALGISVFICFIYPEIGELIINATHKLI
jgi:prepilin signal peptidase PulO-like enzyme (type II secretory pathway)